MKAIVFDVDGVLLDSLAPHVLFCHDMNARFKLGLKLPKVSEGKSIASTPMDNFLRKAGFPEKLIPTLLDIYSKEFPQYTVKAFQNASGVIRLLKSQGYKLCIATSNYKENVSKALGKAYNLFDVVYDLNNCKGKVDAVDKFVAGFGLERKDILFVGDTLKDYESAKKSGVGFIGITHGWEIAKTKEFPTVSSLRELAWKLNKIHSPKQKGKLSIRRFDVKKTRARPKKL